MHSNNIRKGPHNKQVIRKEVANSSEFGDNPIAKKYTIATASHINCEMLFSTIEQIFSIVLFMKNIFKYIKINIKNNMFFIINICRIGMNNRERTSSIENIKPAVNNLLLFVVNA